MTCCGLSTRVLACAVSIHGDDKGLVLPPLIAQYQVVLIPCGGKKEGEVLAPLAQLQKRLTAIKIRATVDTSNKSMGEKLFYWEMKGVPLRLELGPRDLESQQFVLVARDQGKEFKQTFKIENLEKVIQEQLDLYLKRLTDKSIVGYNEHITTCKSFEEISNVFIEKGGFARIPIVSMEVDAKQYEDILREKVQGVEIRGFQPDEKCEGEKCLFTGQDAKHWAYVARAY